MIKAVITAIDVLRSYRYTSELSADLADDMANALYDLLVACTRDNQIIAQMIDSYNQETSNPKLEGVKNVQRSQEPNPATATCSPDPLLGG